MVGAAAEGATVGEPDGSAGCCNRFAVPEGCGALGALDAPVWSCGSGTDGRGGLGIGTGAEASVAATVVSGSGAGGVSGGVRPPGGSAVDAGPAGASASGAGAEGTGSSVAAGPICSGGISKSGPSGGPTELAVSMVASGSVAASCGSSTVAGVIGGGAGGGSSIAAGAIGGGTACAPSTVAGLIGSAMRTGAPAGSGIAGDSIAGGLGGDASGVASVTFGGVLARKAVRSFSAICLVPAITAAVATTATMPAMVGVRRGVGRNLGPSADIAAKREPTMKRPTIASVAELKPIPAKTARNPAQITALTSSARKMIKARIDLSRTKYKQTNALLSRSVHITEGVAFSTTKHLARRLAKSTRAGVTLIST